MRLFVACCLLALSGAEASALEFAEPEEQPIIATLVAEHVAIQRGSGSTRIGVLFEIEDGWHIYAQDPGDAGLPTSVTWSGPSGVSFGPLQWPPPHEFLDPGDIRTFGYAKEVLLASTLSLQGAAEIYYISGTLPLKAKVSWLACREVCIPGKADLKLALPLSPDPPTPSPHAHLFSP